MGLFQFTKPLRTDVNQKAKSLKLLSLREFQFTRPRPNKIMDLAFFRVGVSTPRTYM